VKNYFFLDKAPDREKYLIRPNFDELPLTFTEGSYSVLAARIMQLQWPDYLRMCRVMLNADVVGKGHTYPTVYVDDNITTRQFLKVLNKRTYYALENRKITDEELVKETEKLNSH
jgi:hypothetical protein